MKSRETTRKSRKTTVEENWQRTSYSEQSREPRKSEKHRGKSKNREEVGVLFAESSPTTVFGG
jgi:hypothetical protein